MKDLITEARELCENATPGPWTVSGSRGQIVDSVLSLNEYDMKSIVCDIWRDVEGNAAFISRSRTLIPELCDALEKAEEQNKQLLLEVCKLACESVERGVALARLEAEVMAVTEPKRGEWKNVYKSGYKPNPENVCSECDCWSHRRSDYCPNCGAKMEDKP